MGQQCNEDPSSFSFTATMPECIFQKPPPKREQKTETTACPTLSLGQGAINLSPQRQRRPQVVFLHEPPSHQLEKRHLLVNALTSSLGKINADVRYTAIRVGDCNQHVWINRTERHSWVCLSVCVCLCRVFLYLCVYLHLCI